MKGVIAFLGPSLPRPKLRGVEFRPPARQGDIWRALESQPRAIALIDGVFEHVPSVWHHELRAALASGVAVFGASSMGALRAAELHTLGMIGVGQIFRWYRDGELTDDGAVALLHADAEHGFRPLTVPLVNVMHVARQLAARPEQRNHEVVQRANARSGPAARGDTAPRLVRVAKAIHYQQRSWRAIWQAYGEDHEAWRREHGEDLKALDARECLEAALAYVNSGAPRGPVEPLDVSSYVRRRRILDVHGEPPEDASGDGTRTALLAAWGRSLGLEPRPEDVARFERQLKVRDPSERLRLARVFALEQLMLEHPDELLPDGPSRLEGAYFAALRPRRR